jgi:uncharacterized membrane protein
MRKKMKAVFEMLALRASVLLLIFSMLFSIVKAPLVFAYFTTEHPMASPGLTFLIYEDTGTTTANLPPKLC